MSKFDRYLFKRYFLAGGNRNIIDKLNCSKIERSILENDEHEGRLGFVLNLFVPLEKRSSVDLSIEVPKIYNANCFMIEDDSIEIFVMKDNPVLKK